jgi:hypothetical protein
MNITVHKEIYTKVLKEVFYCEGQLDINVNYFIDKINQGIINSSNNYKTHVKGLMTSWDYFLKDEEFQKVFLNLMNTIEYHTLTKNFIAPWTLKDCWGIREGKGCYTDKHSHHSAIFSGIIYLNDINHDLIINDLNINLTPKKGKFAIFSGNLEHFTKRNLNDIDKYAIVFNTVSKGFN